MTQSRLRKIISCQESTNSHVGLLLLIPTTPLAHYFYRHVFGDNGKWRRQATTTDARARLTSDFDFDFPRPSCRRRPLRNSKNNITPIILCDLPRSPTQQQRTYTTKKGKKGKKGNTAQWRRRLVGRLQRLLRRPLVGPVNTIIHDMNIITRMSTLSNNNIHRSSSTSNLINRIALIDALRLLILRSHVVARSPTTAAAAARIRALNVRTRPSPRRYSLRHRRLVPRPPNRRRWLRLRLPTITT